MASIGFSFSSLWIMEQNLCFIQGEYFTSLGVFGLFKLMVSVKNTRKGFVAMNEALKKESETKLF